MPYIPRDLESRVMEYPEIVSCHWTDWSTSIRKINDVKEAAWAPVPLCLF